MSMSWWHEESRRHRRLVKKAGKLDVEDLYEICRMRGVVPAVNNTGAPAQGSSASSSPGSAANAAPELVTHESDQLAMAGAPDEFDVGARSSQEVEPCDSEAAEVEPRMADN
jgi:hypothetical protein